ncbi:MAG: glycosyltransferase family 4 protein [Bacteroidia bacterium]|nr:glycosyltransferase family 4 protein [Bacteroidia bacterium]
MNILYLSQLGGGHDSYVRRIANELIRLGNTVTILYIEYGNKKITIASENGLTIVSVGLLGLHYYASKLLSNCTEVVRYCRSIEYQWQLTKTIKMLNKIFRYDLVECHEVEVYASVRRLLPVIIRMHSLDWVWKENADDSGYQASRSEAVTQRRLVLNAEAVFSPSRSLIDIVEKKCKVNREITVIPYPVDTDVFYPVDKASDELIILFVGRVEYRKGADCIISAMQIIWSQFPEAILKLVGSVDASMKTMLKTIGDNRIKVVGRVRLEMLPEIYRKASIVVVPSRWDNSPNVIYEAMASGVPVVGSKVGGIPELINDGVDGLLFQRSNVQELAGKILYLLSNRDVSRSIGNKARERMLQTCKLEIISRKTQKHYLDIIQSWKIKK